METILVPLEASGYVISDVSQRLAETANALVGERVPDYDDYMATRLLSVEMVLCDHSDLSNTWEAYALALYEVKSLGDWLTE